MLFEEGHGLHAVSGNEHLIAVHLEHPGRHQAHRLVVVHQQDGVGLDVRLHHRGGGVEKGVAVVVGFVQRRQVDAKDRALACCAVQLHVAPVALDHGEDSGQPQAGSIFLLGGEEGLEGAFTCLLIHTHARVLDLDHHVVARGRQGDGEQAQAVDLLLLYGDLQQPSVGHGVPGVEAQVHQRLVQLVSIPVGPQVGQDGLLHGDGGVKGPLAELDHILRENGDVDGSLLTLALAGETEQPAGERHCLFGHLLHLAQALQQLLLLELAVLGLGREEVHVAVDHR